MATLLLGVASLVTGGCATPLPIDAEHWQLPEWDGEAAQSLRGRAAQWESGLFDQHLSKEGLLLYRLNKSAVGDDRYSDLADQACWSGYLLAALSYHQACEGGAEVAERVRSVLSGIELLHEVTGEPGLLARCVLPLSQRHKIKHVTDWKDSRVPGYIYRSDVSKDQYSGVLFGLVATAAMTEDRQVRERCARLLDSIARHLQQGALKVRQGNGAVSEFGDMRPRILGLPIGVHAALVWAAFEGAAQFGEFRPRGDWRAPFSSSLQPLHFEFLSVRNLSNDVMASSGVLALAHLALPRIHRRQLRSAVIPFLRHFDGEGNALFRGLGAMVGVRHSAEEKLALRNLLSAPTDLTVTAFPPERYSELPRRWMPDRKWRRRLYTALPLSARLPNSFCWKSSPFLRPRPFDGTLRVSGVDLYLAYWLGRYSGWIPAPR